MNYSTYFEHKLATVFDDKINVTVVSTNRATLVESIVDSLLFDSDATALAYISALDAFAVILKGSMITAKIFEDEPKKTK